jgi:aminoglycoside phosphotransferase (APT) family kinase protein
VDRLGTELREDEALLGRVRAVAAAVLSQHGDDLTLAHPTNGWVNPGWISNRYVVRVGLVPAQRRLHREAAVGDALPPAVGYPEVVAVGALDGHEYLLTRRVQGTNLSEAWSTLTPTERADALRQLWELAACVHSTPLHALSDTDLSSSPFYPDSLADAAVALNSIYTAGLLTEDETGSLLAQVERFFDDRPTAPNVLNHGDLHIGNALWRRQEIVSLLDFEFAVIAPMELDLNELGKHVFGPSDANGNGFAGHGEQQAVSDIASGLPVDATLLTGFSILLESWFTRRELGRRTPDEVRATDSCRRLVALADGEGGYLAPMLPG